MNLTETLAVKFFSKIRLILKEGPLKNSRDGSISYRLAGSDLVISKMEFQCSLGLSLLHLKFFYFLTHV